MKKQASEIQTVLIIGNGRMGTDISCQCALYGKRARIFVGLEDPPESRERILERQSSYLSMLVERGMISEARAADARSRIVLDDDMERICRGVDLVSESVLEAVPVKRATWSRFAPYLPEDAVLTSNTSSLVTSLYADASGAPERLLAWHFHTPVFVQNYVDIMPHPGTDPTIPPILQAFSKSIGLNCGVLFKEVHSYLANNMLSAVLDTAFNLWVQGCASYQDIDRAWMAVRVYPIGPFGISDKIGLPLMRDVCAAKVPQTAETREIVRRLDEMIAQGRTGLDAQKGFYDYPDAEFLREDFVMRAQKLA